MFLAPKREFSKFGTAAARFRLVFQMVQVSDKSAFFLSSTAKLSGDRIPVMEARFPAPVQTGPGAFSAYCTMGDGVFFLPGVKRPGRGFHHPPPSRAEVKQRVELYLYFSGRSWPVLG
jgi:hypothetical protein